jgi:hypothetical protein
MRPRNSLTNEQIKARREFAEVFLKLPTRSELAFMFPNAEERQMITRMRDSLEDAWIQKVRSESGVGPDFSPDRPHGMVAWNDLL